MEQAIVFGHSVGGLVALTPPILQSRNDSTVAPQSAELIFEDIATRPGEKQIIWFEET